jgi:hypothetical protein
MEIVSYFTYPSPSASALFIIHARTFMSNFMRGLGRPPQYSNTRRPFHISVVSYADIGAHVDAVAPADPVLSRVGHRLL